MGLEGPYRVHIAPQGYEDERIYEPAIRMDADQVILIAHEEENEQSEKCQDNIKNALDEANIGYNTTRCDFFNLDDALSAISDTIMNHQNDSVKINISSGSKITAVAGTIACMMTSAIPYYAKVEEYGHDLSISKNVSDIISIPTHPIQLVEEEFLLVLDFIRDQEECDEEVAIRDLNRFVQDSEFSVVADSNRDDEDIYDIVNREIITPLVERDYIRKQPMSNKKLLKLTEKGRSTSQLSKHFI